MQILQLCNKSPWPPTEGGAIAMTAVRQGLFLAGNQVYTLAVSTPKSPMNIASIPEEYLKAGPIESAFIDTTPRIFPAVKALLTNTSYQISRFYSSNFSKKLESILQKNSFDAVILESVFMMPYFEEIRNLFKGPIILRAHNVEHIIWKRVISNTSNPLKRVYLSILQKQLKKYELKSIELIDALACISDIDKEYFIKNTNQKQIFTLVFAVEEKIFPLKELSYSARFGHIGSMNWQPNIEGINWFLHSVWPKIKTEIPQAQFHLAGRHFPDDFYSPDAVVIHGEVEDAVSFMQSLDALVVPLLSGSGVRIKIVEALQLGVPLIATPLAVEGLDLKHAEHAYICRNIDDFIAAFENLKDVSKSKTMSQKAKNLILEKHSIEKVTKGLVEMIEKLKK